MRLRTIISGAVIGEVACYPGLPRSASVVADQGSSAFRITKEALGRMRTENSELAVAFHEFMARTEAATGKSAGEKDPRAPREGSSVAARRRLSSRIDGRAGRQEGGIERWVSSAA